MSYQSRDRLLGASDLYVSPVVKPSLRQRVAFTLALWRQRKEPDWYIKPKLPEGVAPVTAAMN